LTTISAPICAQSISVASWPAKPLTGLAETVSECDRAAVAQQLGRAPRGLLQITARCACSAPAAVAVQPRLADGTPFPTLFWLTLPSAKYWVSKLESLGIMTQINQELDLSPALRADYRRAHAHYLEARSALGDVQEIQGISAGGMPSRVKCLHALVAHSLSSGPGINPIGDSTLTLLKPYWALQQCACSNF
jgi:hypothetical protein